MKEKPLAWVGRTLERLRKVPDAAKRDAGHALHLVQLGLEPPDWKPMKSVGPGVVEIRIHADGEYRVFYVAKFEDAIYVIHAFEKKTQKTRQADIDQGKKNYAAIVAKRRGK